MGQPTSVCHSDSSGVSEGADEVVLTIRPVDRKGVLGHVVGEGAVRSVDFGVGTEVDDRCELCWWDHGGADASDRLWQRFAWKEDRGPSPVLGEQLCVEDAAEGPGRAEPCADSVAATSPMAPRYQATTSAFSTVSVMTAAGRGGDMAVIDRDAAVLESIQ
jgi:hypothetical protein